MATPNGRVPVVAVPKGRLLKKIAGRLELAGVDKDVLLRDDRSLSRDAGPFRFLLLKPDDVPTYVEYGAADVGIVGRDVLMEREYDLYSPVDLGVGRCEMAVAGRPGALLSDREGPLRVATKFPNIATQYFTRSNRQIEPIFVQGSVELAPLTGLADLIVDIVETGETLRQNGLVVHEKICDISAVLVANRVGLKLHRDAISPLLTHLRP
ncbi:MAG: ATP phosphoribosyltransferase [Myxococcota bacterium]